MLDIVPQGWEPPDWEQTFYPEDLPPEWRLTYYANEFPAVLVPGDCWVTADESQLRTWSQDVHDGFRFYLADPGPGLDTAAMHEALERVRRSLNAKLSGLVLDTGTEYSCETGPTRFRLLDGPSALPTMDCQPAWRIDPSSISDLRAARAWLQIATANTSGGRGLLVVARDGLSVEDLRRWWDLLRLLGLAIS